MRILTRPIIRRGHAGSALDRELIGRKIVWPGEQHTGTITGVTMTPNSYVRWIVDWDTAAPNWYANEISPGCGVMLIGLDTSTVDR
jgi:hypothetical protein